MSNVIEVLVPEEDLQEEVLIPAGTIVPCAVGSCEERIAKSGNPYLNVRFDVIGGEWVGESIYYMATIPTQEARERYAEVNSRAYRFICTQWTSFCHTLGVTPKGGWSPEEIVGLEAQVQVAVETYQGKSRNVVNALYPAGAAASTEASEEVPF